MYDTTSDLSAAPRTYVHQAPSRNGERRRSPLTARYPDTASSIPLGSAERQAWSGCDEILDRLDIPSKEIAEARSAAKRNGTDLAGELIAARSVDPERLAAEIASYLKIPCENIRDDDRIVGITAGSFGLPRLLKTCNANLSTKAFIAPQLEQIEGLAILLARLPRLQRAARVTTTTEMKRAISAASVTERLETASFGLAPEHQRLSARSVVEAAQTFWLTACVCGFGLLLATSWADTVALLHPIAAILFAACLLMRMAALLAPSARKGEHPLVRSKIEMPPGPVPLYSVLVALYREAGIVPRLVTALDRLDWPKSCIEIKLVCEADDPATIAAVEREIAGRSQFELIRVPPSMPRTKPKALNFALPLTAGEFLVLYDAEDVPDPGQLAEAYARFRTGPATLAALQAPLVIRNGAQNWLAGLFALEYAALFRQLLPWLARHRLPLPLGGTSNHFVRKHLVAAGAWDPHNVTEDADLGIRLKRFGFDIGTISSPTYEEAPTKLGVWLRQRTRWNKGWMQTWLVHNRQPVRLWREIGAVDFCVFQLFVGGLLVSSIAHPIFTAVVAVSLVEVFATEWPGGPAAALFCLDLFNAVGGVLVFAALSFRPLTADERHTLPRAYPMIFVYWILVALATLRAFYQLLVKPHEWEKTPHEIHPYAKADDHDGRIEPCFARAESLPDEPLIVSRMEDAVEGDLVCFGALRLDVAMRFA